MRNTHSTIRARERYNIVEFDYTDALNDILNDNCILLKTDIEKYSHTFLIKYNNKYISVVTDYGINFIKTVLPFNIDFSYIDKLIKKLSDKI